MTGHSRWVHLTRLPDQHAREVQLSYVDGYILALEDVLKDLKEIKQDAMATTNTGIRNAALSEAGREHLLLTRGFMAAIGEARAKVVRSLNEAKSTLAALGSPDHTHEAPAGDIE